MVEGRKRKVIMGNVCLPKNRKASVVVVVDVTAVVGRLISEITLNCKNKILFCYQFNKSNT